MWDSFSAVGPRAILWVLDQVSDLGRATVKRAYADRVALGDQDNQLVEPPLSVRRPCVCGGDKPATDSALAGC